MVYVSPMKTDVVKRSYVMTNQDRDDADHHGGGKEANRPKEEPFAPDIRKMAAVNIAQFPARNDERQQAEKCGDKQRQ
jgi:hypothetical protein